MIDNESGAAIAWRLLATLEGASVLLVSTALLLYSARTRAIKNREVHREVKSVIISNTTNRLGKLLKQRLEARRCTVHTQTGGATSEATSAADVKVDALIIVGADTSNGLDAISQLVTEDVNGNINLLETLSRRVRQGGWIVWTCVGATTDSYSETAHAFDAVLQASLQHVSKISCCESMWIGRCAEAEAAADKVITALMHCGSAQSSFLLTFRNMAKIVSRYLDRCWKVITLQTS